MIYTLIFSILLSSCPLMASPVIHLGIGETYKVPAQPLETLRIQKKGLLQIKDEGSQIVFVGKKLGKTHVQIGSQHYQFVVLHKYKKVTLEQLKEWSQKKRGPKVRVVNNLPEVGGRLLRLDDFSHLHRFTNEKSTFRMAAKVESALLKQIEFFLNNLLQNNNLPAGRLSTTPHWRYQISPSEKKNLSLYKKILTPFGIESRLDNYSITQTPMIEVQLFIAHVKKSFVRSWGLQWPSQATAQWVPGGEVSWTALDFALKALEDRGQGRLLATPRLVTESNQPAEFHSGGEIPIRTTTQFNNNVQWKRYGLFLKTKIKANPHHHIQVDIDLEMSSLDQESSETDVPALTRSHIKTSLNLKKSQPIFLSGFLQHQSGESRGGLPWLSQIPIFRPLFSSGQIYNRDYELVFIIYPRVQN